MASKPIDGNHLIPLLHPSIPKFCHTYTRTNDNYWELNLIRETQYGKTQSNIGLRIFDQLRIQNPTYVQSFYIHFPIYVRTYVRSTIQKDSFVQIPASIGGSFRY